jgi:hypothetical protein
MNKPDTLPATKAERIAYLIAMGFNFPQTEEKFDKEIMNKEALELAKQITGDESPDLEHFVFKGNDWIFEYRPYYGDWVSWLWDKLKVLFVGIMRVLSNGQRVLSSVR